jgi:hypothetical protein
MFNVWIPACAGMTAASVAIVMPAKVGIQYFQRHFSDLPILLIGKISSNSIYPNAAYLKYALSIPHFRFIRTLDFRLRGNDSNVRRYCHTRAGGYPVFISLFWIYAFFSPVGWVEERNPTSK